MPVLFIQFLLWIPIGAIVGWLTGKKMKGYGYGPLIDIAMGATGGVVGGLLFGSPGPLAQLGLIATLPASALGAIILTGLISVASGERRHA